jgi:hypothetical protein
MSEIEKETPIKRKPLSKEQTDQGKEAKDDKKLDLEDLRIIPIYRT